MTTNSNLPALAYAAAATCLLVIFISATIYTIAHRADAPRLSAQRAAR